MRGRTAGDTDEVERSARPDSTSAEETFLYRLASLPVRLWRRWVSPPRPPLETDDFYAGAAVLRGSEVLDALDGRYGAATRISTSGQRSVTLYSAIPVFGTGRVAGAVLASQSTYRILVDLYDLRLDVFILFLGSVAAAAALSLLAAATITTPIRRLRNQAQRVLDARGRLAGRFVPSKRRDEVGDLSRSLGDLSRDLERRVGLLESFASDVAHELRNPLASIRSAVELALSVEEPVERARLLESAIEDTRRMERLISGVREVSLLDSGAGPGTEETVDVFEAAERVTEAVRLARPDAPVRFRIEGERAAVRMLPGRLAQVIANLVENAADFSPSGRARHRRGGAGRRAIPRGRTLGFGRRAGHPGGRHRPDLRAILQLPAGRGGQEPLGPRPRHREGHRGRAGRLGARREPAGQGRAARGAAAPIPG